MNPPEPQTGPKPNSKLKAKPDPTRISGKASTASGFYQQPALAQRFALARLPAWQRPQNRRAFLKLGLGSLALAASQPWLTACGGTRPEGQQAQQTLEKHAKRPQAKARPSIPKAKPGSLRRVGDLYKDSHTGLWLPKGFSARMIAKANHPVANTNFPWHTDPDGAAVFAQADGGFIYVSNSESPDGGASSLVFDASGQVIDAYPILRGTEINCGGGPTPWGTWISAEEFAGGYCWECDPQGKSPLAGKKIPALGKFAHEAIAVDPRDNGIYLTEDRKDGLFYRFISDQPNPGGRPDLEKGQLQALIVTADPELFTRRRVATSPTGPFACQWVDVDNPEPEFISTHYEHGGDQPIRKQLAGQATAFDGGEGIWYQNGVIYFSTKGDWSVWAYDIDSAQLENIYYGQGVPKAQRILTHVDNIVLTPGGDIVVVEDGGNMELNAIDPQGYVQSLVRIEGQDDSEVTGPAFSPDGKHLLFSSQRGYAHSKGKSGFTYQVTGPWFTAG